MAIGVVLNPSSSWSYSGLGFAAVAAITYVCGGWCFAHANHLSMDAHGKEGARINTLFYLVPVLSLLLLAALTDTTIERPDLLIAGAAGVVAVNMVMHLDPEGVKQRTHRSGGHGYAALVLALWAMGAAVLFRDDWLPTSWQVWSVVEYWGMIGVCATVFTLILSFRQSRLFQRQIEMDASILRLNQKVELLAECGDLTQADKTEAIDLLCKLDKAPDPKDLYVPYLTARKLLVRRMRAQTDPEAIKRFSELVADVEVLANLRQQGRNFAEVTVLTIFAGLTVVLAVAARPIAGAEPFASWVHDTTSMVIATAFAFLGFNLIDKLREADAPTLRRVSSSAMAKYGQPSGWRLELVAFRSRKPDRIIASSLGALLLVGAVVMLGFKWF